MANERVETLNLEMTLKSLASHYRSPNDGTQDSVSASAFEAHGLGHVERVLALTRDPHITRALVHVLDAVRADPPVSIWGSRALSRTGLNGGLTRSVAGGLARDAALAHDLAIAHALDRASATIRQRYAGGGFGMTLETGEEAGSLAWLARLLPATERSRFVAEALGNLASCDRRWQRMGHLVGLAIGMPGLAWMIWRESRRGRAD